MTDNPYRAADLAGAGDALRAAGERVPTWITKEAGNRRLPFDAQRLQRSIDAIHAEFPQLDVGDYRRVVQAMIERKPSISADDLVDLRGIYQGIRDGASSVRDWFAPKEPAQGSRLDQLEQQAATAAPATQQAAAGSQPAPKIENATPEQLAGLADDGWPGQKTEATAKQQKKGA